MYAPSVISLRFPSLPVTVTCVCPSAPAAKNGKVQRSCAAQPRVAPVSSSGSNASGGVRANVSGDRSSSFRTGIECGEMAPSVTADVICLGGTASSPPGSAGSGGFPAGSGGRGGGARLAVGGASSASDASDDASDDEHSSGSSGGKNAIGRVPVRGKLWRVLRSKAMVEPSRNDWKRIESKMERHVTGVRLKTGFMMFSPSTSENSISVMRGASEIEFSNLGDAPPPASSGCVACEPRAMGERQVTALSFFVTVPSSRWTSKTAAERARSAS